MTIDTRLAEIRARVENATPGPWEWDGESGEDWPQGDNSLIARQGTEEAVICAWGYDAYGITVDEADAEFIAASRTDLPALLAAVEAVRELHAADEDGDCAECIRRAQGRGDQSYPCPTITALAAALEVEG